MRLDGDEGLSGAGPGEGSPAADDSISYQLDLDSDEQIDRSVGLPPEQRPDSAHAAPSPSAAAAGTPSPAAPISSREAELMARMEAAERRSIAAEAAVAPWLNQMAAQAQGQQPKRLTREELLANPNLSVGEVISFMEQQNQDAATRAGQLAQIESRRGASELHARGLLTPDAMGGASEGFDHMREAFVRPLYQAQPVMRDVIHALFPDQPAMGEYAVAWVRRIADMAQNDPVATYRRLADFVRGGAPAAARQVTNSIAQAAERGAHKISPGSGAAGNGIDAKGIKSINGKEMWRLSDAEFDKLDAQMTGGL